MVQQQEQQPAPPEAATALHRKAHVGKADHQARAMSLPKALRLSLAKVADDLLDMAMAVLAVRQTRTKAEELGDLLEGNKLLMLLDGPMRQRGAAVFDPVLVGGLIQQQTMGKVRSAPEGESRGPTETDAAICAPFLDEWLSRCATLPEVPDERDLISGFAFGARCEEPRLLMMSLQEPEYEVFHLTVDMAGGERQGQVILIFPVAGRVQAIATKGQDQRTDDRQAPAPPAMEQVVMGLSVTLHVAIGRVRMPLGDAQKLQTGDVIDLDAKSFDQAIVQTEQGRQLSRGTLGQMDGMRAVQVEHAQITAMQPRRRASDRAALDLPRVSGDGTGTQKDNATPAPLQLQAAAPAMPEQIAASAPPQMAALSPADLPDMDGLSRIDGLADLSELPDMSDLPGFADGDGLADLQKG